MQTSCRWFVLVTALLGFLTACTTDGCQTTATEAGLTIFVVDSVTGGAAAGGSAIVVTPPGGLTVSLLAPGRNGAVSADSSRFVIAAWNPGPYFVYITKPGYSPWQGTVDLALGSCAITPVVITARLRPTG